MITRDAEIESLPNQIRWENLRDQIFNFVGKCGDTSAQVDDLAERRRRIVANMVRLTEEEAVN